MTGEHVFSDWMNEILSGPWVRSFHSSEGPNSEHNHTDLDWTRKAVCERCNGGWMSDIENDHARPVMGPLMAGEINITVTQADARSIALFAFKTAVILDTLPKHRAPFFSRRVRNSFRTRLAIPSNVNIWMCAYATGTNRADVLLTYYKGNSPLMGRLELFVCTYGVGCFAFQVLAVKSLWDGRIFPAPHFDKLSVPFWPQLRPGFEWPPRNGALFSLEEFTQYHRRWQACISSP